jgi:hypothetical protein
VAQGTVCNVDGRGRHLGQTTQTPHGPEGVAQCKRTAGSAEPAASRPCMVIGWRGGQTTQTPHGPEGGGAVQTHCRLSRASREQTLHGYRVGGRPLRPQKAQRGVAQCKRTAGSAEPAASRPRMVMGLAVVVDTCGRLNVSMCVCGVCVWCGKKECTLKCPMSHVPMSQCPPLSNVPCPNVMSQ